MTTNRWITISAALGVAGGAAWLAKVAVIAAQGGQEGLDVPLFYLGLVLLLVASTGLGARFAAGRGRVALAAAMVLAPLAFLALFVAVQINTEPLAGLVPPHLGGEFGIVLAALAGMVLGGWRIVRTGRRSPSTAKGK